MKTNIFRGWCYGCREEREGEMTHGHQPGYSDVCWSVCYVCGRDEMSVTSYLANVDKYVPPSA